MFPSFRENLQRNLHYFMSEFLKFSKDNFYGTLLRSIVVAGLFGFVPVVAYGFQPMDEFLKSKTESLKVEVKAMPEKDSVVPGEQLKIYVVATPHKGWHIYSLQRQGDDMSLSTRIRLNAKPFHANGPWEETEPEMRRDEALEKVLKVHSRRVEFSRLLTVPHNLKPTSYPINGTLTYRVCDNKVCTLPRDWPFQFHVIVKSSK